MFGVINSTGAMSHGAIFDLSGNVVFSAALQNVVVWNLRQGSQVCVLKPDGEAALKGQVTTLNAAPNRKHVVAGYSNGVVRVWDFKGAIQSRNSSSQAPVAVTLNGHRASVLRVVYNLDGSLLASGSQDTDIIVWDMISEQGLFRLRGHRDGVTDLAFLNVDDTSVGLVSCSKDTLVKVWDLDTQHCVQTIVGHRSEVWGLAVNPNCSRLATIAADDQLRVWGLDINRLSGASSVPQPTEADVKDEVGVNVAEYMGSVTRTNKARGSSILFHPRGHLLACVSNSKEAEVWKVRSSAEVKKKQKRRIKRAKEKAEIKKREKEALSKKRTESAWDITKEEEMVPLDDCALEEDKVIASDELESFSIIKSTAKVRSFSFSPEVTKDGGGRCMLGLGNNSLELYSICEGATNSQRQSVLDLHGHRSDMRAVALSSNDQLVASTSSDMVKVWNLSTRQCIRSFASGFGLCLSFCPGDRHVVLGTREGSVVLYDVASGEPLKQELEAHGGAVWSLSVRPDKKGFATGSADNEVKFWDFEMADENLSFVHTRTLKMGDDVLAVRFSHTKDESKLLVAVAVLDCTVKVFYDDSLKFFLSLYGHKLPVMSMDICDDDTLLVTASADKTIKIWGLDFGDCHRSLLAHEDSIMNVSFVRDTHYFFSASKDKTIKYWDADHYEQILLLEGHQAEVWSLAVSNYGTFFVSSSHDRSLRVWERTDEPVFLEEEREKQLENMFESELDLPDRKGIDSEEQQESALASKRSIESIKSGERLMDAIEIAREEQKATDEFEAKNKQLESQGKAKMKPRPANPLLLGKTPLMYLLYTIQQIRSSELEQALLVLSFSFVEELLKLLHGLVQRGLEVELCAKCIIFLLRIHQVQIISNHSMINLLDGFQSSVCTRLEQLRDDIGINIAGLKYLKRQIDSNSNSYVLESEEDRIAKQIRKG